MFCVLPVFDPIIDIVNQITQSAFLCLVVGQPQNSFLDRFGKVRDSLLGLLLTRHGLFVGEATLACDRAAPDQGVAEDGSLEELLVVREHLIRGLAVKNLVLRLEMGRSLSLFKWLLS